MPRTARPILTINGGSSSIKFSVFEPGDEPRLVLSGSIDRIGSPGATLCVTRAGGRQNDTQPVDVSDPRGAAHRFAQWLGV